MTGRELYERLYVTGEAVPFLPIHGVGPWAETRERWEREGLPAGADVNRELGLVCRHDEWLCGLPLNLNMVPAFPVEVLARDPEFVTLRDEFGVTKRLLAADFARTDGRKTGAGQTSSMAQWLAFPVRTRRDWDRLREARFRPTAEGRFPADWPVQRERLRAAAPAHAVALWGFPFFGLFSACRELMGLEGLVYAMADDPGLVHAMVADFADYYVAVIALAVPDVPLDMVTFFEDMCATKAPLVSPAAFRTFFAPGYRRLVGGLRELGVRIFHIDTDGNPWPLIPEFIACGLTGLSPCEAQAGCDVAALRAAFPAFSLSGGIDKRALTRGPGEIDRELRRCFAVAWRHGRYTPGLDHGAPPDIPWANMCHYARRYVELCESPSRLA